MSRCVQCGEGPLLLDLSLTCPYCGRLAVDLNGSGGGD